MLPHPLTNSEMQKYQNEPKFKGADQKNNLHKGWGICNQY